MLTRIMPMFNTNTFSTAYCVQARKDKNEKWMYVTDGDEVFVTSSIDEAEDKRSEVRNWNRK